MRLRELGVGVFASVCFSQAAMAGDYGCTVLLCLANPAGPKAAAACVAPITQLFKDLARGKGFPTCAMVSAPGQSGGNSWAEQKYSYYDQCPTGAVALANGMLAILGTAAPATSTSIRPTTTATVHSGIGEGDGLTYAIEEGRRQSLPRKVCVGSHVADTKLVLGDFDSRVMTTVGVYDRIVLLDPQASPNVIDVYINDTIFQRVRW